MESRGPEPAAAPREGGLVLVVDDSAVIRHIIGNHLRDAGYRIEEAADGAAAIQMARDTDFDVIVTDLQMPKVDGFGVLEAVKSQRAATEVIILTGSRADDMSVLLAHTAAAGALEAARRIVAATAAAPFETDAGTLEVTVSIGVASYAAPQSASALVADADAALYAAKKAGRNRAAAGSA